MTASSDAGALLGMSLPYDLTLLRRFRTYFDRIEYATFVTASVMFVVIWLLYPVPLMLLMLKITVLRCLGLMACFGLALCLPVRVGALGVTVMATALIVANSAFIFGVGYLWITPGLEVLATLGICFAMLASISSRRQEPLYTFSEIVMIGGACALVPYLSYLKTADMQQALLTLTTAGVIFAFYLFALRELMAARQNLLTVTALHAEQGRSEALGRLTGGVAHDFNNLLTVIGGNLDLMEQIDDVAERRVLVNEAQTATARAGQVTRQLLAYSRRAPLHPEPLDVVHSLTELDMLMRRLLKPNIVLTCHTGPQPLVVCVDRMQFDTVLLNLCINARDAIGEHGTIRVEAALVVIDAQTTGAQMRRLPPGPYVRIAVADDGTGMTPEVLGRALEPYFTTKPKGQGSGMGLPMASGFAGQSGGLLDIRSVVGEGTVATLLLPALGDDRGDSRPA